jgi:photosystem II stability/assembly factor-like uncharacterized protein
MKRLSVLVLSLCSIVALAQCQWTSRITQKVVHTGSIIFMQSGTIGWMSGQEYVSKTTDGGESWNSTPLADTGHYVRQITFLNDVIGFAIGHLRRGNFDYIYRTADGGATWHVDSSLYLLSSAKGLCFQEITFTACADYKFVWLRTATYNSMSGAPRDIYCSKDSGRSWNEFANSPDTAASLLKVLFADSTRGFILTTRTLYRTTNTGRTWDQYKLFGGNGSIAGIQFFSSDSGLFYGNSSATLKSFAIGKTYDCGATWNVDTSASGSNVYYANQRMFFTDMNHGLTASIPSQAILRTTTGGSSWTRCGPDSVYVHDMHSADARTVVAVGNGVLVSHDSGMTFRNINPSTPAAVYFTYVQYVSKNLIVGMGGTGSAGSVYLSVDSGSSWTKRVTPALYGVSCVAFLDSLNGWIGDNGSQIFRTTDFGMTWVKQKERDSLNPLPFPKPNILAVHFFDKHFGCAVGEFGFIAATNNGGEQWKASTSPFQDTLCGVFVASPRKAWIIGISGTILVSSDSCKSWTAQASHVTTPLRSITFTDTSHGYILGDGGVMLKTTNGGATWEQVTAPYARLNGIKFIDRDKGWVVGEGGTIFKTLNGGLDWQPQTSGVGATLTGIDFIDSSTGIVVGNGVVLTTRSGGEQTSVLNRKSGLPSTFKLEQNYPNPFNPTTTIEFTISKLSIVNLKIFDLLGREVATLVSEQRPAGNYSVKWDAGSLSSGIYFYQLRAGSFVATKKLLLLK